MCSLALLPVPQAQTLGNGLPQPWLKKITVAEPVMHVDVMHVDVGTSTGDGQQFNTCIYATTLCEATATESSISVFRYRVKLHVFLRSLHHKTIGTPTEHNALTCRRRLLPGLPRLTLLRKLIASQHHDLCTITHGYSHTGESLCWLPSALML